jgi:hypothetical protein
MELAVNILKNILLPKLDKDFNFDSTKINDSFLEKISLALIAFENDAKPLYTIIYSLELEDAEKIISKIPLIYSTFIKELAEQYVLGYKNSLIDKLIENKNETFLKEASFLKTMNAAITKSGRKQLKKNLLQSYERLVFELDEKTLESVAKKKSREDLKSKFKQWDKELVEVETEEYSFAREPINLYKNQESKYSSNSKRKSISLSWIKYATIAAIFIIGFMIWQPNKLSNNELFAQYNSEESIIQSIDYYNLAIISESGGRIRGNEVLFQNYTNSETIVAMKAIELFKNNNYENSKKILTDLNPRDKNNKLLLFLAISQLKTKEVNKAVSNLEHLSKIPNYEFADDVKLHLALGYINQNKKKKAKDLLEALVSTNNKYSNIAQEILNNMRWF